MKKSYQKGFFSCIISRILRFHCPYDRKKQNGSFHKKVCALAQYNKEEVMEKKKKKLGTPHTLVIIVCLIILAAAATYVVPSGEFVRYEDPVSGRTVVEAGSYTPEGTNPVSFLRIPGVMYQGILEAVDVIAFLMIIGGAFELVNTSGAILALCRTVGKKLKGKEIFVVPMFLTLFAIFGTTMGMSNEVAIFVPIGITMALTLGLDKVTGMAMVAVGAATGFTAGLMNPFTVGVAQDIAGVPLFSGMGLRAVLLIAMLVIDTFYIIAYERKIKKHPEKSILAGLPDEKDFVPDEGADEKITGRQTAVLVVLFGTLAILIYGLLIYQWYFEEMAALLLVMGVICGFLAGLSPSKIATTFTAGAKGLAGSALTVGFARGIIIVLEDAMIIDTISNTVAMAVNALPAAVQSIGFFLAQTATSFVITSGSGMAAVTIPLMSPVADLIGLSRQTLVLAYQMGDGFSNLLLPTTSSLLGTLAVSRVPYGRWVKFMFPLFLLWTVLGCVIMALAVAIGY